MDNTLTLTNINEWVGGAAPAIIETEPNMDKAVLELIKDAYVEGYGDGYDDGHCGEEPYVKWLESETLADLQQFGGHKL